MTPWLPWTFFHVKEVLFFFCLMLEQSNGSSSTLTKVGGLAEIPTEIWVRRTRHACDEPPSDGFYGIYTLGILDVSDSQWWAHQERVQMPNDAERTFGIAWTTGTSTALARTGLLLKQHNVEFSGAKRVSWRLGGGVRRLIYCRGIREFLGVIADVAIFRIHRGEPIDCPHCCWGWSGRRLPRRKDLNWRCWGDSLSSNFQCNISRGCIYAAFVLEPSNPQVQQLQGVPGRI